MSTIMRSAGRLQLLLLRRPAHRSRLAAAVDTLRSKRLSIASILPSATERSRLTARVATAPWRAILAAASFGALAMYLLDPGQGRRRRALARDQFAHAGHAFEHARRRMTRRGRFLRGVAKGVGHDAAHLVRHDGHYPLVDNETLVARVRSEVLGDERLKAGEIHVDAYEGCVTLRGQLQDIEAIRRVINAVKHVEGVVEVRSYLHLPGEIPPNKAEAWEHVLDRRHAM